MPTHAAPTNTTSLWRERRADAVRDYLASLGLTADRITVVSMGEEQSFCTEETEACWQQNRRGHFVITAK